VTLERSEVDLQNAAEMRPEQKPQKYTELERAVLSEIANHDITNPVTLHQLTIAGFIGTSLKVAFPTPREVKAIVATLRDAGEPIGASRGRLHGYYWASSVEDLESAARPMLNQAFAMLRTARKLLGRKRLKELAGQAAIDEMFGAAE
jgi:hypothetical protein